VTVNHTGGQWLVVENVRVFFVVCTEKLHYGGLEMSENRRNYSSLWQDLANPRLF